MFTLDGSLAFTTNVYLYLPIYISLSISILFKITLLGIRSVSL